MSDSETETISIQSKASQLYDVLVALREANKVLNDLNYHPKFTVAFRDLTFEIIENVFFKLEELTKEI